MEFNNLFEHKIEISMGLEGNNHDWIDSFIGELVGIGEKFVVIKDTTDDESRADPSEIFVPIAQIKYMTHDRGSCRVCDPSYEDKRPTSYDPNWRFTSDR